MKRIRINPIRSCVILLAAVALILIVWRISQDQNGYTEPETAAKKLHIFATDFGEKKSFEDNWFTGMVEEKFKVDLEWMSVPGGAASEKRKMLLLAGSDYPEIFMTSFSKYEQFQLGQNGTLLPLNELIEQFAPNVKKAFQNNEELRKAAASPNGKIYFIPTIDECFHCSYPQKIWMNKMWLDKLDLPAPRTYEELYRTLTAFKKLDPNGNGAADEIPLSGSSAMYVGNMMGYLMNAFVYYDGENFLQVQNGKVSFIGNSPEYRQGLRYLRKLYEEGLIDPNIFAQSVNTFTERTNGSPARVGAFVANHAGAVIPLTSPLYREYEVLPPLIGPAGKRTTGFKPHKFGSGGFVITDKATPEQAEAIIRIIDFLYTEEGTMLATYGKEGEVWEKAAASLDFNGNPAKYRLLPAYYTNRIRDSWWNSGQVAMTNRLRESFAVEGDPLDPRNYEYRLYYETKTKYEPYRPDQFIPPNLPFTTEELQQVELLRNEIGNYLNDQTVQFVLGAKNLDDDWAEYMAGFNKLNVNYYVELTQRAYDSSNR
ncbi:extracellular solute-binding protein [Paenibacillus pasadenensis]|uniref:extracellular solute-binding protein n=1 Tax=Paenibacillus pasadenensis TaxID=217090 RepID=UPI0020403CCA|nr:extracellular solute-binding protein [Paenibacillus pasadenensis]MCM3746867.1 extracellular solute-binding protein [Paenibacillus pasadenensis]